MPKGQMPAHPTKDASGDGGATRPSDFFRRDWQQIIRRIIVQVGEHRLSVISAGVAFYALLALFPAISALVGLYGLIANPQDIAAFLDSIRTLVPREAFSIIERQTDQLIAAGATSLGLALGLSLLIAMWSAKNGVSALMQGLNAVYYEHDKRTIGVSLLTTIVLTLVLICIAGVALVAIVAVPIIVGYLPLGGQSELIISVARWPILFAAVVFGIAILYRYGPHRESAKLRWISWGAVLAATLWVAASVGFSYYVANFASYNEIYGSLGAIVILLMWFWLTAYIVLLGAELNAEMEHQTAEDTTVGPDHPMGERGAYVADHQAKS